MENNVEARVEAMPRIGERAPSFTAVTTQGEIKFPEQYEGNWVILFTAIRLTSPLSVPLNS